MRQEGSEAAPGAGRPAAEERQAAGAGGAGAGVGRRGAAGEGRQRRGRPGLLRRPLPQVRQQTAVQVRLPRVTVVAAAAAAVAAVGGGAGMGRSPKGEDESAGVMHDLQEGQFSFGGKQSLLRRWQLLATVLEEMGHHVGSWHLCAASEPS